MSGIKLTISASIHGALPYKWVRSTSTSTRRFTSPFLRQLNCTIPNRSTGLGRELWPASLPQGRRLPPCAPPPRGCSAISSKTLGLTVLIMRQPKSSHRCLSYFSSSDSDNRGEFVGSKNMVAENAKSDALLNPNDSDQKATQRDSSLPSMQDAEQKSIKLLTLPTILTLGRVAAVPLLISCMFLHHQICMLLYCNMYEPGWH